VDGPRSNRHNAGMASSLERELIAFRRSRPDLLKDPANRGLFALVHDDEVAGLYTSFDAGLAAGYDRFGLERFMVKEVVEHETPKYFPRGLQCPT